MSPNPARPAAAQPQHLLPSYLQNENLDPRDPLHNSLRSVVARARAVCGVAFLANSGAIGCKKAPCSPSRSAYLSSARVMQRVPRAFGKTSSLVLTKVFLLTFVIW